MSDVDWTRVKEIFAQALESPRDDWDAILTAHCAHADERRAVEDLLGAHDRATDLFAEDEAPTRAVAAAPDAGAPGSIGPYEIGEKLGEGGFGVVYRAHQRYPVEREVAVKILKRGMDTSAVVQRFQAERQMLARMQHDDIARVLDAGATPDGRPFVVMELVQGEPIVDYCRAHDLDVRQRVALVARACRAIHHAHQRAVIHRDVKPSNILVTKVDGEHRPRIIDFGIAKALTESRAGEHTQAGDVLGTPRYMSPEQVEQGAAIDIRTDVYSLGVVLCEVLTGRLPRDPKTMTTRPLAESPAERPSRLAQRHSVDVTPADERLLKGDLDRIVLKCVAWEPDQRYDSAAALAADLERYLRGEPVLAVPPTAAYRARKFILRHRLAAALAAAACLSLIGGTAAAVIGMQRAIHGREQAARQAARAEFVADFFLRDMLDAADPDIARGDDVMVRSLLNVAQEQAVARFADDPEILIDLLSRIGRGLAKLSEPGPAQEALEAAIVASEALYGPDDPITLSLAIDVEVVRLYNPSGHERAIERRRELRDRVVAALGPTHPISLHARYYGALGQETDEYLDELETVEQEMRRQGMTNTEVYVRLLRSLAITYDDAGDLERRLEFSERALALAEAYYGEGHSTWLEIRKSMADAYVDLGRLDDAEACLAEVRDWETRIFGPYDIKHLATLNILIDMNLARERPDLALANARESADIARELFGHESIPHSTSMQLVGRCLVECGMHEEATPLLERVLVLRRQQWGETHHYVGVTLSDLSRAAMIEGDPSRAAELAAEARTILNEDDRRWFTTTITLAEARAALGDVTTARDLLDEALRRLEGRAEPRLIQRLESALDALPQG